MCVALGALLYIGRGPYPIAAMQHPSIRGVPDVWYSQWYSLQSNVVLTGTKDLEEAEKIPERPEYTTRSKKGSTFKRTLSK